MPLPRTPTKENKEMTRTRSVAVERLRHDSTASQSSNTDGATRNLEDDFDDTCSVSGVTSASSSTVKKTGAGVRRRRPSANKDTPSQGGNRSSSMKRQRVEPPEEDTEDMDDNENTEDMPAVQDTYTQDENSTRFAADPTFGRKSLMDFYTKIDELKKTILIEDTNFDGSPLDFLLSANDFFAGEKRYKLSSECQRELFRVYFHMLDIIYKKDKEIQALTLKLESVQKQAPPSEDIQLPAPRRSFAEVLSEPKAYKPKGYEVKHIAVLEMTTEGRKVDDIRKDLLTELDPRTSQIKIRKTTVTKNGKLLVHCDSDKDVSLLKEQIASKPKLGDVTCNKMKKMNPRILVAGVTKEIKKEDIVGYITSQNGISITEGVLEPRFSFAAGQHNRNWVLEADPKTFQTLMKKQRIFVGITSCRIENYIRTVRCFKCCRLGHVQAHCSEKTPRCSRCHGEHVAKDCKVKDLCCINCSEANEKFQKGYNIKHSALDSKCPTEQFHRSRLLARIDFGVTTV